MAHTNYKDKIRVVYKNYPLNSHPWAIRAALGAECARLQNPDAFWDFARDYYSSQGSITVKNIDDHIHATAKRLNLDVPTLDACMNGKAAKGSASNRIRRTANGRRTSTPTLFVNGVRVVGLAGGKGLRLADRISSSTRPARQGDAAPLGLRRAASDAGSAAAARLGGAAPRFASASMTV